MKIFNDFIPSISTTQLPAMPIEILEFLAVSKNEDIMNVLQILY